MPDPNEQVKDLTERHFPSIFDGTVGDWDGPEYEPEEDK